MWFRYVVGAALCVIAVVAWMYFISHPLSFEERGGPFHRFELLDPETAPESIKPLVIEGYHLMLQTHKNAPDYAHDWISCTNCHFSGGNTLGDFNGGISLVGVTTRYPRHLQDQTEYTLADRINACFEKSLNGKPLPKDSREMKALLAYLDWISRDAEHLPHIPWLGLKKLRTHHVPNPQKGALVYADNCAMCHGQNGEGQKRTFDLSYPPLWGDHAFNDAAGMNTLPMLSSFVYHNMPYHDPQLSVEEAFDVAAFIIQQPRPKK